MFWAILSVFFLCNVLLVWGVFTQRRDPFHRPPVMTTSWFHLVTMIGGIGWLLVPAMCLATFGFFGALASILAYLFSSVIIAFPIIAAADGGIAPSRG